MDFSESLQKMKEETFEQAVRDACESLGIEHLPEVKFWDTFCPADTGHELAHIHIETRTICISRVKMNAMSLDNVREIAYHEVSHLINPDHSPQFHSTNSGVRISTWKPGGTGSAPKKAVTKPRKERIDTVRCNYHACRKKDKLYKCDFCGGYFCKEHEKPKPPGMPRFTMKRAEDAAFMELWRSGKGHPCPDFMEHYEREREEQKAIYSESLDKLIKSGPSLDKKLKKLSEKKRKSKKSRKSRWKKMMSFLR